MEDMEERGRRGRGSTVSGVKEATALKIGSKILHREVRAAGGEGFEEKVKGGRRQV